MLVAAHGNSLRALVKHLEGISDEDIAELNIPYAIPRLYELGPDLEVESVRYLGDAERGRGRVRRGQAPGGLTTVDQVASNVAMTWSKVLLYLSG